MRNSPQPARSAHPAKLISPLPSCLIRRNILAQIFLPPFPTLPNLVTNPGATLPIKRNLNYLSHNPARSIVISYRMAGNNLAPSSQPARRFTLEPNRSGKATRLARNLESAPQLVEELVEATQESLSLREEIGAARVIVGESVRMLGRATAANDGVMPQGIAAVVLDQMLQLNTLISSCAAIEAKRLDQQFDAAKLVMLIGKLRQEICSALKDAGFVGAVPFVQACFGRARWTGALDQAAVDEALAAPQSFDVKFRPIERDDAGRLREHRDAFETPQDALANAADLDLTSRSDKMAGARAAGAAAEKAANPLIRAEDADLKRELEQANDLLDAEIEAAKEAGQPLPGVSEMRASKLDRESRRLLDPDAPHYRENPE